MNQYNHYSKWFEQNGNLQNMFQDLFRLFRNLLLQTNGDVREALNWMTTLNNRYQFTDELGSFIDKLKERGLITENDKVYLLSPKGNQAVRKSAFEEIFTSLRKKNIGNHSIVKTGKGFERLPETRAWAFGDSIESIDMTQSVHNALRRSGIDNFSLQEDDLEVRETEHLTSCATVLLIDISHSMVLYGEDRITPAKNVALALSEFIMQQYAKDSFHVVSFGDDAEEIQIADLPYLAVGPYHTNTKEALRLGRQILSKKKHENKQIFMITDGKPSCIWEGMNLYKNPYGLDRKIVNQTLREAVLCRKEKIEITTFMVSVDPYLQGFVRELSEANKGRAYFTGLKSLGEYMFYDFVNNRRKKIR
ncbi:MAG: VWA domain-containing protein [Calditrichales bacterium]|nr:MAG: VWA domain-containing protein [Calditrichales bacterium]